MTGEFIASLMARKAELTMLKEVIDATGLPEDVVLSLVVTSDDLDAFCDTILSEISVPFPKVASFGR